MKFIVTEHFKENSIPLFLAKKVVKERKGFIYKDTKEDRTVFKYNKTIIVVKFRENKNKAVLITGFRNKNTGKYDYQDRFKRIN